MSDQLGLFGRRGDDETGELDLEDLRAALTRTAASAPAAPRPPSIPRREQRAARLAAAKRRQRRRRHTVLAVLVLVLLIVGGIVGFKLWRKDSTAIPDFQGAGTTDTVVRVLSGDTLTDIADTLATDEVVASSKAFVNAAANNGDVAGIKTGYYRVKLHASAAAAVSAITDPSARVGQLRLIPGRQLADIPTKAGAAPTPGYITSITQAACVPLNGVSNCFTAAQLWQVEQTADPTALGVVSWAWSAIAQAPDPKKRLEGMLVPGDYNIAPGSTPMQALQSVMQASAANWNATDIVADASAISQSPYAVAVVASLVEREGNDTSRARVARVAYNRLAINMKLQFDSTVDYALGKSQVSTTSADRQTPSPYNTYFRAGLPPTPITSPGPKSLDAALNPDDGNWLYFVKIEQGQNGAFCFSQTYAEHSKCVAQARAAGVFGG